MSGDNLRLDFTSRGGAGAPTLTTPTLTPTTLRNIEQMFLDHESSSILDCPPSPPVVHENAAHFVPPYVALSKSEDVVFKSETVNIKSENLHIDEEDDDDDDDDEDSQETDDTKPMYLQPGNNIYRTTPPILPDFPIPENGAAVVRPLPPEIALRLQLDFPSSEAKLIPAAQVLAESSGASSSSATSSRGRRQPARGGAEPTNDDDKRRLIRRERNKEAAARCRKRRVDQTVCLEEEVSQWEERNDNWKREIETLEAQKRHLLSLLDGHRTGNCKMGGAKKL